jgi:translocation protein SEC66
VFRKRLDEIQSQAQGEKEWWEKRRASIQKDFLKELDGATETPSTKRIPSAKTSTSDEDTVLVESGGPAANVTGSIRKKKAKK